MGKTEKEARRQLAARPDALTKRLHPRLKTWFESTYPGFTHAQLLAVPAILDRESILLTSPTGSGKTLAGFLGIFDTLLRKLDAGTLTSSVQCIYVSPLRALAYDIEKNVRAPIVGMGLEKIVRLHLRTGDTPSAERVKFRQRAAHILITTPESLAVMLAQESYAAHLGECEFVIVDELHSFAGNKRGADLTLSLERLERLCRQNLCSSRPAGDSGTTRKEPRGVENVATSISRGPQGRGYRKGGDTICRIGLSATAAPLDLLARFLVGEGRECRIAEAQTEKKSLVEVFSPIRRKPYPPAGYTGVRLYAELAELIRMRQSVLVFTNVRSAAEQVGLRLKELLPDLADQIEIHHASLDRSVRLEVEDRLKNGELRAVVCSTSLEMGIDIGAVDLVVMVATPKGVSRAIQRIGRSGHSLDRSSHGVLVATNINDLVEATVTAKLVRERALDPIKLQEKPYDVVAQHIVGLAAVSPVTVEETFALIRSAYPFRDLSREEFDRILQYLEGGGASLEKQYAGEFGKIRVEEGLISLAHPRIAREFLVNIGTIHSEGFIDVLLRRRRLGSVEENFIKQLQIGDLFVLGGRTVRLIDTGVQEAYVERADGHLPTIPRWNAAKMPLTSGVARAVRQLRTELEREVRGGDDDAAIADWLVERYEISIANAQAIVELFRAQLSISDIPIGRKMLIELYREGNHAHYFFHSLIGRSANDALSRIVALRVKNRIGGNALATIDDYGFLLTLRRFQELPLEELRQCFESANAEGDLATALRGSELVKWQFRGVAQTGLMVPRNLPGKKRKQRQLSWSAEVLFRVLEQHEPGHPLLVEAYRQATHTFLDAKSAYRFLDEVQDFEWRLLELPVVSPFSFAIYASVIKENMMLEDPTAAIERIYREMYAKVESVTSATS
ncbi:MAG TPA: DEAD/DEAH box helicase [Chthoniobacterales bacterium]|nr:DEAD/DEAH box helicase [Chthoniobacterales bacterium]